MNAELQLFSITRKRSRTMKKVTPHKVLVNRWNQDFATKGIKQKMVQQFHIFITYRCQYALQLLHHCSSKQKPYCQHHR